MEYLTDQELTQLLAMAKKHSLRDWLMILVGYTHGLRAGEIVNIKLVDIVNDTLTVRRLKGSEKTTQELRGHAGNPLFDEVRGVKELISTRARSAGAYLFLSKYNTAMTTRNFFEAFRKYAIWAGIPPTKRNPHILKHTLGTAMADHGANNFAIQKRLGHRDIKSTAQYVHMNESKVDTVVNNMMLDLF